MLAMLLEERPRVVSFHFGLPPAERIAALTPRRHRAACHSHQPGGGESVAAAGIDAVVAQGSEAGGHRGVFDPGVYDERLGTIALTRLLVRELQIPVIAAGGIMDGAGIAAGLLLGASTVQLGTAFITCPESAADEGYRAAARQGVRAHRHHVGDLRSARAVYRQPIHGPRGGGGKRGGPGLPDRLRRREGPERRREGCGRVGIWGSVGRSRCTSGSFAARRDVGRGTPIRDGASILSSRRLGPGRGTDDRPARSRLITSGPHGPRRRRARPRLSRGFPPDPRLRGHGLHAHVPGQDQGPRPALVQHGRLRQPREGGRASGPGVSSTCLMLRASSACSE